LVLQPASTTEIPNDAHGYRRFDPRYHAVRKQGEAPLISRATNVPWQSPRTNSQLHIKNHRTYIKESKARRQSRRHRIHDKRRGGPAKRPNRNELTGNNKNWLCDTSTRLIKTRIILRRRCTNSKGGDASRTHIVRYQKNSEYAPTAKIRTQKRTYKDDEKNDETNRRIKHNKSHTTGGPTTPREPRPQHQKQTNTSFRRGCGKLLAYRRPSHGHRPVHATGHKPRKLHTYPLLYYSITSKGGHTAKLKTNQYDAFARVY